MPQCYKLELQNVYGQCCERRTKENSKCSCQDKKLKSQGSKIENCNGEIFIGLRRSKETTIDLLITDGSQKIEKANILK